MPEREHYRFVCASLLVFTACAVEAEPGEERQKAAQTSQDGDSEKSQDGDTSTETDASDDSTTDDSDSSATETGETSEPSDSSDEAEESGTTSATEGGESGGESGDGQKNGVRGDCVTLKWQVTQKFEDGNIKIPSAVSVDASGDILLGGRAGNGEDDDLWFAKFSSDDGEELWSKLMDGGNGSDAVYDLVLDGDGDVYFAGVAGHPDSDRAWVGRVSGSDGEEIWSQLTESTFEEDPKDLWASAVALSDEGELVSIGRDRHADGDDDAHVIKRKGGDGELIWEERVGGELVEGYSLDRPGGIDVASDGSIYGSFRYYVAYNKDDYAAFKMSADGGEATWVVKPRDRNGTYEDNPLAVVVDSEDRAHFTGRRTIGLFQYWVERLDGDGELVWSTNEEDYEWEPQNNPVLVDAQEGRDGQLILSGNYTSIYNEQALRWNEPWFMTLDNEGKTSCWGAFEWDNQHILPPETYAYSATTSDDGTVIVVGEIADFADRYFWMAAFSPVEQ